WDDRACPIPACPTGRRAVARMAPAPPLVPARPRQRGAHLDPAFEFSRDRPRPAEPGHGAASRRTTRRADARTQRAAGRRRLRAVVPRAVARRPGARLRTVGGRTRAGAAE